MPRHARSRQPRQSRALGYAHSGCLLATVGSLALQTRPPGSFRRRALYTLVLCPMRWYLP